jgi:hypothetical protein
MVRLHWVAFLFGKKDAGASKANGNPILSKLTTLFMHQHQVLLKCCFAGQSSIISVYQCQAEETCCMVRHALLSLFVIVLSLQRPECINLFYHGMGPSKPIGLMMSHHVPRSGGVFMTW